jgi:hypothetical protein
MAAHRFAITFNPAVKLVISSSVLRSMAALANLAQFAPHRLKPRSSLADPVFTVLVAKARFHR